MDWPSLRAAFPWLAELPEQVVARIDVGELAVPGAHARAVIERAQAELPAYLISYRRDAAALAPSPGSIQLCQLVCAAQLTAEELLVVREAERRVEREGLVLCAYARPLSLRGTVH